MLKFHCCRSLHWPNSARTSRPQLGSVIHWLLRVGMSRFSFQASTQNDMAFLSELKQRARHLKADTYALYLAARDPRTPWYAKLLVAGIVAYAFSPIDLIPDFVPVIGYLDDLILIPIGIVLAIKLIPHQVLAECRVRANETVQNEKPVSRVAGAVIVMVWLISALLCFVWAYNAFMV